MPERRRYSSLSLVHSHGVKHNFLFTFPFPQVLNNAPKIYVEIESKRRDMKQSMSGVACVCILLNVTAPERHRQLFWFMRVLQFKVWKSWVRWNMDLRQSHYWSHYYETAEPIMVITTVECEEIEMHSGCCGAA